jgi:hypothetical protein
MSDTGGISMEQFNINELAGATGLILGAVSGILVVVFKSRCYCKFRVGLNDNCSICMCERKPPPDIIENDSDDDISKKKLKNDVNKDKNTKNKKILKVREAEPEPEPERDPDIERLI